MQTDCHICKTYWVDLLLEMNKEELAFDCSLCRNSSFGLKDVGYYSLNLFRRIINSYADFLNVMVLRCIVFPVKECLMDRQIDSRCTTLT